MFSTRAPCAAPSRGSKPLITVAATPGGDQDPKDAHTAALRLPHPLSLEPAAAVPPAVPASADLPTQQAPQQPTMGEADAASIYVPPALRDAAAAADAGTVSEATLERWLVAYQQVGRAAGGDRALVVQRVWCLGLVPGAGCSSLTLPAACDVAPTHPQMVADARELGIPGSAIPPLPPRPTEAELRAARDRLAGMIASFLSAGL